MVGEKKAKSLLLSGSILNAEEALAEGLVTELVAEGQLMPRVRELGGALAQEQPGVHERSQETAVLVCQGAPRS